ncbi:MAG: DNA polymerase III subunit beta, partial [Coriobacteriia bacterium]|nr:DNA polymerase III subunit beta [Coriobacteriia bacterium]
PEISATTKIILQAKVVGEMIGHVVRAVSRDETIPIFTGVLVVSDGPTLRMVATDSYRLAVKETLLESPESEDMEVVVPGKALEEVAKMASSQESVALGVSDNQIVFEVGDTVFITRRIEGTFPNYRQLIPKEFETNVTVPREEFAAAVKRVSLLAQHNTPLRLTVSSEDKTLSLSATTQDIGDASEDLMADIEGPDVEIAFNHQFLNDGMAVATGDTVKFEIVSPLKPGVITSHGDEGFMYLLMPVRLG